jgi:DNA-binding CsgD family transcriptional regulator
MSLRRFRRLSPREYEILLLVLKGLPNKAIAGELSISEKTVKRHRQAIMAKIGVMSIPELVHLAIKAEIVE